MTYDLAEFWEDALDGFEAQPDPESRFIAALHALIEAAFRRAINEERLAYLHCVPRLLDELIAGTVDLEPGEDGHLVLHQREAGS